MRSHVIALVLLVVPRMVIAQTGGPTSVGERYLLAAANAERVGRGLPALRWDDALRMGTRGRWQHGGRYPINTQGRQSYRRADEQPERVSVGSPRMWQNHPTR
jgi:hypothetical protein